MDLIRFTRSLVRDAGAAFHFSFSLTGGLWVGRKSDDPWCQAVSNRKTERTPMWLSPFHLVGPGSTVRNRDTGTGGKSSCLNHSCEVLAKACHFRNPVS